MKEDMEAINMDNVPQYLIDAKRNAIQDCRLLYCGVEKPLSESLMRFGWECGDGWNDEIAKLSYRLESMNILFYPKYRTRIEAMQIKEKFGYFRGYFNVVVDPPFLRGLPARFFGWLYRILERKIDYGYVRVVDSPFHKTEGWDEISKEDFDGKVAPEYVSNDFGWKFEERGGKYYRNCCIHHTERSHRSPTKHKILHRLMNFILYLRYMSIYLYPSENSREQNAVAAFLDSYIDMCVEETEKRCHDVCEYCGRSIGNEYNERCECRGWIQYICKDCAKNHNLDYINSKGELCNPDGSVKLSREEFEKQERGVFGDTFDSNDDSVEKKD